MSQVAIYGNTFLVRKLVDVLDVDLPGYQQIKNSGSLGKFTGSLASGLATGTYHINISVDGVAHDALAMNIVGVAAASHEGSTDRSTGKDYSVAASVATHTGSIDLSGGHDFSGENADSFTIRVTTGGVQGDVKTIHLAANDADLAAILAEINAEFLAEEIDGSVEAVVGDTNKVTIRHKSTGANNSFILAQGGDAGATALTVLGLTAATYTGVSTTNADFTIAIDGGTPVTVHLTGNDANLAAILAEINAEFVAGGIDDEVEAVAGTTTHVKINRLATGSTHSFTLVDGTNTPLVSDFGMTAATYSGTDSDTWAAVVGKIQTSLRTATSHFETVAVFNGKIKVTADVTQEQGDSSAIAITDGASNGILAAIDALGTTYTPTLETAVAGKDGNFGLEIDSDLLDDTEDMIFIPYVQDSAGKEKTGLCFNFYKTGASAGYIVVSDDAATKELAIDDVVTILGAMY